MRSIAPWHLLLGTGVLFGLGLPLSRLAEHDGIDVLAFALWPTLAAAVSLAALGWLRHGPLRLSGRLMLFGVVAGALGHAIPVSTGYWLAREAGAGFAALAYTLPPVLTLAMSVVFGLEAPMRSRLAAVVLGLAGAVLLASDRLGSGGLGSYEIAALLLIPMSIAGGNVYRAIQMPRSVQPEWLAALALFGSAGVLGGWSLLQEGASLPLHGTAVLWPALQAILMVVAYLLFFALQRQAEPVTTSFVAYVSMATGLVVATIGFGERFPDLLWPGLGLIAGSMWLLKRSGLPVRLKRAVDRAAALVCPARCATACA